MSNASPSLPLDTPAAVARAVLDAIDRYPDNFDMDQFLWVEDGANTLRADETPGCGTVMCAAGWAAHLTGWDLCSFSASKGGVELLVEKVGAQVLGLSLAEAHALFYSDRDTAYAALTDIANG